MGIVDCSYKYYSEQLLKEENSIRKLFNNTPSKRKMHYQTLEKGECYKGADNYYHVDINDNVARLFDILKNVSHSTIDYHGFDKDYSSSYGVDTWYHTLHVQKERYTNSQLLLKNLFTHSATRVVLFCTVCNDGVDLKISFAITPSKFRKNMNTIYKTLDNFSNIEGFIKSCFDKTGTPFIRQELPDDIK